METWTDRTELLIGEKGLKILQESSVLIVGVGGVGGIAAEMICRAGIGKITLIDGDIINVSNINRQIIALTSTLYRPKVEVMAERLSQINPELKLTIHHKWLDSSNTMSMLEENHFDFVIDAIDTLVSKVFLIKSCVERNIPIISSMGAGGKLNPSKVMIKDISETTMCSLARAVRQQLAKMGIKKGLPVVYSTEPVIKKSIIPVANEANKKSTIGSISYIPAVFGCYLTSFVIGELLNKLKA